MGLKVSSKDDLLTLEVSGQLKQPELANAQKYASELIRKYGDIRVLVLAEKFTDWARDDNWTDVSFMLENDKHIKRMAVLVDKKWEEMVIDIFIGKVLRLFPIERFKPSEKAKAIEWLDQD